MRAGHTDRRNLYTPARIAPYGFSQNSIIGPNQNWATVSVPVIPGARYWTKRETFSTIRFRFGFSTAPPVTLPALTGIVERLAYLDAVLTVPAGQTWMHIYVTNTGEPVPPLWIERIA